MATMIPASSISATLSADLTYNPSIHVQTVEIDRTGTSLIAMATDNYVKWFITKQAFLALCRIETLGVDVSNTRYTLDARTRDATRLYARSRISRYSCTRQLLSLYTQCTNLINAVFQTHAFP